MLSTDTKTHPNLKLLKDYFQKAYSVWLKQRPNISSMPAQYGVPNVTADEVNDTFVSLNAFLDSDEAALLFNPAMASHFIRHNQWASNFLNIEAQINALPSSPGNWPAFFDQFVSFISQLYTVFSFGPNFTADVAKDAALKEKISATTAIMQKAEQISSSADASREKAMALLSEAEKTIAAAISLQKKIDVGIDSLEDFKKGLNQKGLAEAFSKRAKRFYLPITLWLISFAVCILVICSATLFPTIYKTYRETWVPIPNQEHQITTETSEPPRRISLSEHSGILLEMLVRVLMCAPVIWAAWFSAKQYSVTKRLKEEYEFKAATAMAYYGYQMEASRSEQLANELLQGAIKTFNEKPDVAFDGNNHRVSPIEELMIEVLKKADPSEVTKMFENLIRK